MRIVGDIQLVSKHTVLLAIISATTINAPRLNFACRPSAELYSETHPADLTRLCEASSADPIPSKGSASEDVLAAENSDFAVSSENSSMESCFSSAKSSSEFPAPQLDLAKWARNTLGPSAFTSQLWKLDRGGNAGASETTADSPNILHEDLIAIPELTNEADSTSSEEEEAPVSSSAFSKSSMTGPYIPADNLTTRTLPSEAHGSSQGGPLFFASPVTHWMDLDKNLVNISSPGLISLEDERLCLLQYRDRLVRRLILKHCDGERLLKYANPTRLAQTMVTCCLLLTWSDPFLSANSISPYERELRALAVKDLIRQLQNETADYSIRRAAFLVDKVENWQLAGLLQQDRGMCCAGKWLWMPLSLFRRKEIPTKRGPSSFEKIAWKVTRFFARMSEYCM